MTTYEDILKKYGLSSNGQTGSQQTNTVKQSSSPATTYEDILKKYGLSGNQQTQQKQNPVLNLSTITTEVQNYAKKWENFWNNGGTYDSDGYNQLVKERSGLANRLYDYGEQYSGNTETVKLLEQLRLGLNDLNEREDSLHNLRKLMPKFQEAAKTMDDYAKKVQNGEWLSEADRKAYGDAFAVYADVGDRLITKENGYTEQEIKDFKDSKAPLSTQIGNTRKYFEELGSEYNQGVSYHQHQVSRSEALNYDEKKGEEELAKILKEVTAKNQDTSELKSLENHLVMGDNGEIDWEATAKSGVLVTKTNNGIFVETDPNVYKARYHELLKNANADGSLSPEYDQALKEHEYKLWAKKDYQYLDLLDKDNFSEIVSAEKEKDPDIKGRRTNELYSYEKDIYYYIRGTEGQEAADEFIDHMTSNMKERRGWATARWIDSRYFKGTTAALYGLGTEFAGAVRAMAEPFADLDTAVFDYANTALQTGSYLTEGQKKVHRAGMIIGNQIPAIIGTIATGNPEIGRIISTTTAYGKAEQQGRAMGMTSGQAKQYAMFSAAGEYLLERVSDNLFGAVGLDDNGVLTKKLDLIKNGWVRAGANMFLKGLGESVEEVPQDLLEPLFVSLITGEEYTAPEIKDILETVMMTFITTGIMEVAPSTIHEISRRRNYKSVGADIIKAGGVKELKDQARKAGGVLARFSTFNINEDGSGKNQDALVGQLYYLLQDANKLGNFQNTIASTKLKAETPATPDGKTETAVPSAMDVYESTLAEGTGASADPVATAIGAFTEKGNITNKQIQDILNNSKALDQLREKTGLPIKGTNAERRNAVREAVAQLAQENTATDVASSVSTSESTTAPVAETAVPTETAVDTTAKSEYDNITNLGGEIDGYNEESRLPGTSEAGLPGGVGTERIRTGDTGAVSVSGQASGAVEGNGVLDSSGVEQRSGSNGFEVQLRVSPVVRVSDQLQSAQTKRGTQTYQVRETTSQPDVYSAALYAGRDADSANGWCVTGKTGQELREEGVKTFMNDSGTVGVGVAQDGDIVAVFKNPNGGPARALDTLMPIAIEQGGDRLDCYGEGLVQAYENYGFTPVARVEFNPEYANDGWTPDKGTPYIYFMIHNGDSSATVVENMRKYPHMTAEQLNALPTYGKDDYDAAMEYRNSLLDSKKGTDTVPPSSPGTGTSAVTDGATPANVGTPERKLQRSRPGDVRPIEVHEKDPLGRNVSEFVGNAYGSEVVPDNFTDTIKELEDIGALGYDKKSNAQSLQEAADRIKKRGFAATEKAITNSVSNGKIGDTDIASAMLLFNYYVSKSGQASQDRASELFVDLQMMATQTGRDLQLYKMLRKMTPQGQLMSVTKNVKRYVDNINKGRKKRNQADVEIPKELQSEYMEAAQQAAVTDTPETQQRKQEAEQAIYEYAAANIKSTFEEKWNAWRYMSMLGNPKTQIRNIVGNAAFRPFVETKRYIGAALEAMFLKQENKTKSLLGFGENDRALLKWAREDARSEDTAKRMEYTGQTGDSAATDIDDLRTIFGNKALEKARTGLQDLMSAEDMIFKRGAYTKSLASFLKARGVTAQQLETGDVDKATLTAARNYATQEAMKATFNDRNAVSDFVTNNFRYKGNNTFGKMANAMAEGVIPFRRTPANILVRGLEYSPAGLLRSMTTDVYKVAKGEISGATYIDNISAALTGTGAFGIGVALAAGVIEGVRLVGNVEDEDEKRTGHKSYALEIGGRSYPIEWAAPTAFPLFIGANFYDTVSAEGNDDVSAITAFLDAAANTLEPMLELSTLSSLNDLITDARYAEEGKEIYSILASAATSYFMQALPTLGGQIEQAFEDEKKSVYADSSDPVYSEFQKILGRVTQKIPGIDLYQIEKTDAWGRTEEKGRAEKIFDAFINPSNDQPIIETDADKKIMRLNKALPDENVSPKKPDANITITEDGKKITRRLTGEEYQALSKAQEQKQKELVDAIIANPAYAGLSDADKAKAIGYAYDYARDYARGEVIEGHEGITTAWMQAAGDDPAGTIMGHVAASTFSDPLEALTKSWKKGSDNETAVEDLETAWENYKSMSQEMQEMVLSKGGKVKEYITARMDGMTAEEFAGSYRVEYTTDNAFDSLVSSWKNGEDNTTAVGDLEDAWTHYQGLSYQVKNDLKDSLTGRQKDYITAREAGISAETFTDLYKTYYSLNNSKDMTAKEKATEWSLELEKARVSGDITTAQRDLLKDEMYFTQSLRAKSARFDGFVDNSIPAESAFYVDSILNDLIPESGKSTVREIQKIEAVANADRYLTESQQQAAMKTILDDDAFAKYQKVLALGKEMDIDLDTDAYAESYRLYLDMSEAGGEKLKERTINEFQKKFRLTYAEAKALYEIYKPKATKK